MRRAFVTAAPIGVMATSPGAAIADGTMQPQTRENVIAAAHGEAYAPVKYGVYAEQAKTSGSTPSRGCPCAPATNSTITSQGWS